MYEATFGTCASQPISSFRSEFLDHDGMCLKVCSIASQIPAQTASTIV